MLIESPTAADASPWDRFVESCEGATFFHRLGWCRVVERVMGHEPAHLVARDGDRIVGVLPLMRVRRPFGGVNHVSVPHAVYGGPLGESEEVRRALLERAMSRAESERVGRLELRYLDGGDEGARDLATSELYATFRAELPRDKSEVLARMPKKSRAEARKARDRHGLELSTGVWYLEDLYRLFHRNKHALGSPGLPMALFRGLIEEFGEDVIVHLVRRGREPLAAVMSFLWKDTVYAYYAGTEANADRAFSASNFMYMALREWSVENGWRRFDFGRSRRDSGAYQFKSHQGFEAVPLVYRYHLVRDRGLPTFTPSNPRTRVLRSSWSRLPTWATRRLSDRLARYLP